MKVSQTVHCEMNRITTEGKRTMNALPADIIACIFPFIDAKSPSDLQQLRLLRTSWATALNLSIEYGFLSGTMLKFAATLETDGNNRSPRNTKQNQLQPEHDQYQDETARIREVPIPLLLPSGASYFELSAELCGHLFHVSKICYELSQTDVHDVDAVGSSSAISCLTKVNTETREWVFAKNAEGGADDVEEEVTKHGSFLFLLSKWTRLFLFRFCERLERIELDPAVKRSIPIMRSNSFYGLSSIVHLDLSGMTLLQTIGRDAVSCCPLLVSVNLSGLSRLEFIGADALSSNESLTSVDLSGAVALKGFDSGFASRCPALTSVNVSGCTAVENVAEYFMFHCESLEQFDFGGFPHLKRIGRGCFNHCSSLKKVAFASTEAGKVKTIAITAPFAQYCPELKDLQLP